MVNSMKTMGFVISRKNREKRRACLPKDIKNIKSPNMLFFEKGYGESVNVSDEEYVACGCNCVSRAEALSCDIICDVKLGDADYLCDIDDGKILFGWAHAVQNCEFSSQAIEKKHTVVAWEEIFENGRYIFYRNREIAGEAAVLQAFTHYGRMPYECRVAIIGNGQTAKGALRILHGLGAAVDVYDIHLESLFCENMFDYDVIVNCVMWDTSRTDRLIYAEDLSRMKKGAMIIDVSCDPHLEIETSHPTTIDNPVYTVDGILHYAVDNTPAMFPFSVTNILSQGLTRYIDTVMSTEPAYYPTSLKKATVILNGEIMDERIKAYVNLKK